MASDDLFRQIQEATHGLQFAGRLSKIKRMEAINAEVSENTLKYSTKGGPLPSSGLEKTTLVA